MLLQRSQSHDEPLFINLTPMIDVILTLLVFFITASRIEDWQAEEDRLDVSLPQVGYAQPLMGTPDDLRVSIHSDGSISMNEEIVTLDELIVRLRQAQQRFRGQGVLISADGRVYHQRFADVVSACNSVGIAKIGFAVQEATR